MIISNNMLHASQFVEYYCGLYFTQCDTFNEAREHLRRQCIYIGDGLKLTEIDKIDKNAMYVLVEFSLEDDYTQHEYRIMRIQKKYVSRFMKNMREDTLPD